MILLWRLWKNFALKKSDFFMFARTWLKQPFLKSGYYLEFCKPFYDEILRRCLRMTFNEIDKKQNYFPLFSLH